MKLEAFNIVSFPGAHQAEPKELKLLESSSTGTILILSLIINNYHVADDAALTIERRGSDNAVKFKWPLDVLSTSSPFFMDSKMVFTNGDKLVVTSDNADVSVEATCAIMA